MLKLEYPGQRILLASSATLNNELGGERLNMGPCCDIGIAGLSASCASSDALQLP